MITPIEKYNGIWLKRDDFFSIRDCNGGKVRTCWHLATKNPRTKGLITAGSRSSPQINIVAQIAKELNISARAHAPTGELSPELKMAQETGMEIIQHKPGYNSVIVARAREDAQRNEDWVEIPFGMECWEAVKQTATQIKNLPSGVKRIVVPVGSGMSLAGILRGLSDNNIDIPVLGICVGANPGKRLRKYAPLNWQEQVTLESSDMDYHKPARETKFMNISLDPIYEAKCLPFLKSGDLFWIVGIRATAK